MRGSAVGAPAAAAAGADEAAPPPQLLVRSRSSGLSLLALNRMPKAEVEEAARLENDAFALSALSLLDDRPTWAVDADSIHLGDRIGMGTFGIVYRGSWQGRPVAVKKLRLDNTSSTRDNGRRRAHAFIQEMQLMAALAHPHVVAFLGGCLQQGDVSMVHELCAVSLHDVLHEGHVVHPSLRIPVAVQLKWAREVASGVAYLHAHDPPVVHRDLKPGNVLLTDAWVAKITDFGAARLRDTVSIETARIGTCQWTAPEVLRQQPHDERADSYSFGVLLFELAARRMPYEGVPPQQVEVGVITGQQPRPDVSPELRACDAGIPDTVFEALTTLVAACFADEPTRRPRFPQIESELQSAQNLLLRDVDSNAWTSLDPSPWELPELVGPADGAGGAAGSAGAGGGWGAASCGGVGGPATARAQGSLLKRESSDRDLRVMVHRHLHHLLSRSAELIDRERLELEERRRSSRQDEASSTSDEDTDTD